MILLLALLLDVPNRPIESVGPLPPGRYPMIEMPVDPRTYEERMWLHKGVVVSVDDRIVTSAVVASTAENYVDLVQFYERPGDILGVRIVRMLGKVKIGFESDRAEKAYRRWLRSKK